MDVATNGPRARGRGRGRAWYVTRVFLAAPRRSIGLVCGPRAIRHVFEPVSLRPSRPVVKRQPRIFRFRLMGILYACHMAKQGLDAPREQIVKVGPPTSDGYPIHLPCLFRLRL
jgi:hypothetical protein